LECPESFDAEFLNNLYAVKNVLKECPLPNLIPMKFDELVKKKSLWKGIFVNKIVTIYVPSLQSNFSLLFPLFNGL